MTYWKAVLHIIISTWKMMFNKETSLNTFRYAGMNWDKETNDNVRGHNQSKNEPNADCLNSYSKDQITENET